jgi:hypothetical protein
MRPAPERPCGDDDAGSCLWRPGTRHDDELGSDSKSGMPRPGAVWHPLADSSSQLKIDWRGINAILENGAPQPAPVDRADKASGPDAPPQPAARGSTAGGSTLCADPPHGSGRAALAPAQSWLRVSCALLAGCMLGFGLAWCMFRFGMRAAPGAYDFCGVPEPTPAPPVAPQVLAGLDQDALAACRKDTLGEELERSRAETALQRCNTERKNLLEQLNWLAAAAAKSPAAAGRKH